MLCFLFFLNESNLKLQYANKNTCFTCSHLLCPSARLLNMKQRHFAAEHSAAYLPSLKCKCDVVATLTPLPVTLAARGEVTVALHGSSQLRGDPQLQTHTHTHTLSLQRFSGGPSSHNASVTRRSRCLLCPAAPWIRKVLAPLSDRVSRIDLNILTCLVPGGAYLFNPDP